MNIHHTPEHYEEQHDKDTSQKITNTSRAGITMHAAVRRAGSEA